MALFAKTVSLHVYMCYVMGSPTCSDSDAHSEPQRVWYVPDVTGGMVRHLSSTCTAWPLTMLRISMCRAFERYAQNPLNIYIYIYICMCVCSKDNAQIPDDVICF